MNEGSIRKSTRYEHEVRIDVSLDGKKQAVGTLIDISKDGIGFRASPSLRVGGTYHVAIAEIGAFACRIKHCTNYNRYGGTLMIDDERRRKLGRKLDEQFG